MKLVGVKQFVVLSVLFAAMCSLTYGCVLGMRDGLWQGVLYGGIMFVAWAGIGVPSVYLFVQKVCNDRIRMTEEILRRHSLL